MIYNIGWTIWISAGVVIVLILFGTITLMVTPADSVSAFGSLVRQESLTINETTTTSDAEVQKRIDEIYKRKGYSNPNPDPEDYPDDVSEEIKPRIDGPRRNRPLQKIGKDFDPKLSYVIRHSNGTLTYVFPEKITISSTTTSNSIRTQQEGQVANNSSDSSNNTLTFRNQDSITFPDHEANTEQQNAAPKNDACSSKDGLCLLVPDYPIDEVNQIMNEHVERYAALFGNDIIAPEGDKLVPRFDTSDDEYLCNSVEKLVHPKSYFENGQNSLIVNTDKFKQGVRIETCAGVDLPCNKIEGLSSLKTTACKQVYHYRTLVSIDFNSKKPVNIPVRIPSCCKCVIRTVKRLHQL